MEIVTKGPPRVRDGVVRAVALVLALLPSAALAQEDGASIDELRVLFIGNSYTFVNDLPRTLQAMALASTPAVGLEIGWAVFGGGTLQRHWGDTAVVELVRRGRWDYVVLQEQSLLPIEAPDSMLLYGSRLAQEIVAAGATPVLYLTWARKNRPSAQDTLDRAYLSLARATGGLVVPVGPAWQEFRRLDPGSDLYMEDGSHPSPLGSFLAASAFYRVLFGAPPPRSFRFGFQTVPRPGTLRPERTGVVRFSARTRAAVDRAVEAAVSRVQPHPTGPSGPHGPLRPAAVPE